MTIAELLSLASAIRDPDTRQDAIVGLLQAGDDLDLTEARAICRRAGFRAARAASRERARVMSTEQVIEPEPVPPARPGAVRDVFRLLSHLTEEQRQVFILRHVSEYSPTEIAELLSISRQTVHWRLKQAKTKFEALVKKLGGLGLWDSPSVLIK
jgi:RNA polymerase sigma factor (sigma-70 family)